MKNISKLKSQREKIREFQGAQEGLSQLEAEAKKLKAVIDEVRWGPRGCGGLCNEVWLRRCMDGPWGLRGLRTVARLGRMWTPLIDSLVNILRGERDQQGRHSAS